MAIQDVADRTAPLLKRAEALYTLWDMSDAGRHAAGSFLADLNIALRLAEMAHQMGIPENCLTEEESAKRDDLFLAACDAYDELWMTQHGMGASEGDNEPVQGG